jgi:DNA modification methylase
MTARPTSPLHPDCSPGSHWQERLVLPGVELYLGDCRELLASLKADAVITDPPYGIKQDKGMGGGGYDSTGRWKRKPRQYAGGWDDEAPDAELLQMVIASSPVTVMWGGNYLPLGRGGKWLVWNKEQVMPTYSDAELAWTNAAGISVKLYTLHCNKARIEMGLHPTQKPVQLMGWSMDQAKVPEGATVLDPFMGSGSTIIAAIRTGRKAIGIEKDPEHFKIACERIKRELAQGDLFHGLNS